MDKVERDGKVAVLYSPGFGAGWSTWCHSGRADKEWMIFAPELVEAVLAKDLARAVEIANSRNESIYTGGAYDLEVCWVPKGAAFRIEEYDGAESIVPLENDETFTA